MKDFKTIIALCLTVVNISANHHPQVYEDEVEYSTNENIRTTRNSESTYRTVHQPSVFNFEAAKQQDYRKVRYAEQQKMNTVMVNGMSKSHRHFSQPQTELYKTVQGIGKDTNDWQPFDPKIAKQNTRNDPGLNAFKITKDAKLYKPDMLKIVLIPKNTQLSLLNTNIHQIGAERNTRNPIITRNSDLDAQGSESVEKKIDLRQTPKEYNKIIFVHPNQLQDHLQGNTGEKLTQENSDVSIKKPETQLTALNDLIGKNPNVQLEGLKRLLADTESKNYNVPVKQGPESFQNNEHTDIAENGGIPNIKINPDDNSLTLQTPHLIGKESLADIQKQLDEAAKLQAEQVIARAQQEAQAQVEAQHKAIALAQIQAQKIALENIQKSIYGNAQDLSSEQNNHEDYHAVTNNLAAAQLQTNAQTVTVNHNIPSTSHNNVIHSSRPSINALENDISIKDSTPSRGPKPHVVSVTSGPRKASALYENTPAHSFGSKEVLYYAPNHHHQVAAQLQAEKALLSQVQAQNMAILHNHKHPSSGIRQLLTKEHISSSEQESASNVHAVAESKPEATAYQQIILESKEVEDVGAEQKDYDDIDDLQYAAKYAFGYRIKDAKEGNDFGHEERRDGKNLEGSYHVLLPDGRLQKVEYYADNSGYHAKVTYEHLAHDHEETSA